MNTFRGTVRFILSIACLLRANYWLTIASTKNSEYHNGRTAVGAIYIIIGIIAFLSFLEIHGI